MSPLHALLLGLLQGLTELFPVSSLGHGVLLPQLLGWHIDEGADSFLVFLVATHLATALVLFSLYRREWILIIKGMFRSFKKRTVQQGDSYAKIGWLLVVATVPAGILGLLFEDKLTSLFASPIPVASFLVLNGFMLLGIERFKKNRVQKKHAAHSAERIAGMTWRQSIRIGMAQCLSLLPGFSRTGATLGGGLLAELDHADAAQFSFLLATPIIFAAAVLKLPELFSSPNVFGTGTVLLGALAAALGAYVAVRFLSNYFKTKTLTSFGVYCIALGCASLLYFLL